MAKKIPPAPIATGTHRNDPPAPTQDELDESAAGTFDAAAAIAAEKAGAGSDVPRGTEADDGTIAINYQNTKKVRVDRFKLSLEKCLKNRSISEKELQLVPMEHRHFWDSRNRQGKPTTHTEFMCGHKHKVEYQLSSQDPTATIIAKSMQCGPALSELVTMLPNGKRNVKLVPVSFGVDPNSETGEVSYDRHTHTVEYLKSEDMTVKL